MTEPVRPPSPDLPAPPRSRDLLAPPSPVLQQPSAQPAHAGDTRPSISLGSVTSVAGSRTSNSKTTLIGMSIVGLLLAGGGVLAVALGGRASSEDTSDEVVQSDDSAGGLGDSSDSGDSLDSDGPTGRNLDSAAADESSLGSPDGSSPQPSLDESSGTSQDSASIYMERDEIYGEAVAVVWSQVANADDPSWAETVQEQVDQYSSEYGGDFVGIRGDEFRSTKGGTVAVVHRGGFSDARAGASWCRSQGLTEDYACFGLRLSDDFDFEARGPDQRMYPANL